MKYFLLINCYEQEKFHAQLSWVWCFITSRPESIVLPKWCCNTGQPYKKIAKIGIMAEMSTHDNFHSWNIYGRIVIGQNVQGRNVHGLTVRTPNYTPSRCIVPYTQRAHVVVMTSYWRWCDVIMSTWRHLTSVSTSTRRHVPAGYIIRPYTSDN